LASPPADQPKTTADSGLTIAVVAAVFFGAAVGLFTRGLPTQDAAVLRDVFGLLSHGFLRAVKAIIAPLVLSTLLPGVARLGGGAGLRRIAAKTLLLFLLASLVAIALSAAAAILWAPGAALHLSSAGPTAPAPEAADLSPSGFLDRLIPVSFVGSLADNAILQVVVFSILGGLAAQRLPDGGRAVAAALDRVAELMFELTRLVMRFAPLGVFGASALAFAAQGLALLAAYATLVGEFYLVIAAIWIGLAAQAFLFLGPRAPDLFRRIRPAAVIAFATASSEVALPKVLMALEAFGVRPSLAGFVLPIGYSFNLVGSMAYCVFGVLFVIQAFQVPADAARLATAVLLIALMSKGMASVPRASILVVAAVLPYLRAPDAGLALLLGVDQLMDMGRTATNVAANAVATASVAAWERDMAPAIEVSA
jgi:Na+/H+-dicarboxylate symporter